MADAAEVLRLLSDLAVALLPGRIIAAGGLGHRSGERLQCRWSPNATHLRPVFRVQLQAIATCVVSFLLYESNVPELRQKIGARRKLTSRRVLLCNLRPLDSVARARRSSVLLWPSFGGFASGLGLTVSLSLSPRRPRPRV